MGDVVNGLLALGVGAFISYGAVRVIVSECREVLRARALRQRGRTTIARIVSVSGDDPESRTRRATVTFDLPSAIQAAATLDLHRKDIPASVPGMAVAIRYDPANPRIAAAEAGGRQGHQQCRQAVIVSALMIVLALPTSIRLVHAGVHTLLP